MLHFFALMCIFVRGQALGSPLREQSRFGLRQPIVEPVTTLDVVSVLCRFKERYDFYEGEGYGRPSDGNLLTASRFAERIRDKPFRADLWPLDSKTGLLVGVDEGVDHQQLIVELSKTPPSDEACKAIFTAFAKGATGGVAYPVQVDEELDKFVRIDEKSPSKRIFDQNALEFQLALGKLQVAVGWFLFIGLQGFAIYHLFLRAFVKFVLPDFYDVLYH